MCHPFGRKCWTFSPCTGNLPSTLIGRVTMNSLKSICQTLKLEMNFCKIYLKLAGDRMHQWRSVFSRALTQRELGSGYWASFLKILAGNIQEITNQITGTDWSRLEQTSTNRSSSQSESPSIKQSSPSLTLSTTTFTYDSNSNLMQWFTNIKMMKKLDDKQSHYMSRLIRTLALFASFLAFVSKIQQIIIKDSDTNIKTF